MKHIDVCKMAALAGIKIPGRRPAKMAGFIHCINIFLHIDVRIKYFIFIIFKYSTIGSYYIVNCCSNERKFNQVF